MRSTIHLVTARDAFALRSWTQAALERGFASSPFAKRLEGIDLEILVAFGRELVDDASLTSPAARGRSLAARWPDGDQEAMAYAVAAHLAARPCPATRRLGSRRPGRMDVHGALAGRPAR